MTGNDSQAHTHIQAALSQLSTKRVLKRGVEVIENARVGKVSLREYRLCDDTQTIAAPESSNIEQTGRTVRAHTEWVQTPVWKQVPQQPSVPSTVSHHRPSQASPQN